MHAPASHRAFAEPFVKPSNFSQGVGVLGRRAVAFDPPASPLAVSCNTSGGGFTH